METRSTIKTFPVAMLLSCVLATSACTTNPVSDKSTKQAIATTLDQLHLRASAADFDGYFDLYADEAVFMGTDRDEYWPLAEFKAYTRPHFDKGNGWTYVPTERILHVNGSTAWFEERLQNEKYGEVRGTGVLVYQPGGWKIAQYNLALPLPNTLFSGIAQDVKKFYAKEN